MKTIILIPTYNERENIRRTIREVFEAVPLTSVMVIDDDSPDKTADVVRELMGVYPNLLLLERSEKAGLGEAYKHAIREVLKMPNIEAIVTMDADGSHDVQYLQKMIDELSAHDIVVGSRYVKGGGIQNWEAWRFFLSKYGNLYSRILLGVKVNDLTAGFVATRRSLLEQMNTSDLGAAGYAYQIEYKFHAIHDHGARAKEVPIIFKERREGESKLSGHIVREGLITPLRLSARRFVAKNISQVVSHSMECHVCGSTHVVFYTKKNGHNLFECTQCKFLFVHPIPKNLEEIYSKEYYKNEGQTESGYTDYDKDKEPMRHIFEIYLNKLAALVAGRRIFDVGAATGYFLDIAKEKGWETFGSELSDFAAEEAAGRGHIMIAGDISTHEDLPIVDVVTLWDVLEHVADPRAYLKTTNNMMNKGGILAINTVDRSSIWARVMGKRWHLIVPPEHLHFYTQENIRTLLDESGFEILEIKKIGKKFSPAYIFKTLGSWQGLRIWNSLARISDNRVLRSLGIPINLRDNMFVLARKINDA